MLPRPFINYIPKFFTRDEKLIAFADKMDSIMDEFESDALGLNTFIDPFRCPAIILNYLGDYLSADIKNNDSERTKRIKIATAVKRHKNRSTFADDIKILIDNIANGNSKIINSIESNAWVMGGNGYIIPSNSYWGSMGGDGINNNLGLALIGNGNEVEMPGNIYIDVDNNSLSASEISEIVEDIENRMPAYFIIYIGYTDGSGKFILYTTIS